MSLYDGVRERGTNVPGALHQDAGNRRGLAQKDFTMLLFDDDASPKTAQEKTDARMSGHRFSTAVTATSAAPLFAAGASTARRICHGK